MGRWFIETDSDTIASIELYYPVVFTPERTCRNVAKDKEIWFVCEKCLYECSPPTMVKYCFNWGARVAD